MGRKVKRLISVLLCLTMLFLSVPVSQAVIVPVGTELGTMRVYNCREWVSLREEPDQRAARLAKVPLGELVFDCRKDVKNFVYCQYDGKAGYILIKYLEQVTGAEAVHFETDEESMTMEEILSSGDVILDWREYNIQVIAAHEEITDSADLAESIHVGCYVDGDAIWGYSTAVGSLGEGSLLKAFMGGTEMDPAVMVYNGARGLTRLDLLSGREQWTLSSGRCQLGDAAVIAVADDGNMYIAGTDGPAPVAVSGDGKVLWKSQIKDKNVYEPYEIELTSDEILVKFESGMEDGYMLVSLQYDGRVTDISEVTNDEDE